MSYKLKRVLKKLNNRELAEDIKQYIKTSHYFYEDKVPEMRVLAKRLHEENSLKEFYNVFDKLWGSKYSGEKSLAIHTLELYENEFNLVTWRFLKSKLKDMRSWDEIDSIAENIVGKILVKNPGLKREILRIAKKEGKWLRRMAIISTLGLIEKGDVKLSLWFCEVYLNDSEESVKEAVGLVLKRVGEKKREDAKRFILKHIDMPDVVFNIATEDMKELRKVRKLKKLDGKSGRLFFWRGV